MQYITFCVGSLNYVEIRDISVVKPLDCAYIEISVESIWKVIHGNNFIAITIKDKFLDNAYGRTIIGIRKMTGDVQPGPNDIIVNLSVLLVDNYGDLPTLEVNSED